MDFQLQNILVKLWVKVFVLQGLVQAEIAVYTL